MAPAPGTARSAAAPLVVTGLLWLAAGLSMGYWVLQSVGRKQWEPVPALASSVPQADIATIARALGAAAVVAETPAAPAAQTRYRLWGMVAQPARQGGAALIAVGDEPPRPVQVGDAVSDGLVLQSVAKGIARLGPSRQGPTTIELNLPAVLPTGP
ncbi:general secretion pathway protein C [Hydrogenophaga sp. PAMC20947]|nr:general secretion pathway protein C [Hydrogenophaga sp. PAMC20947]